MLDGSRVAALHGASVGNLVAFRWQSGWVQVPLQIDERFEVPYQTIFQGYNLNTALTVLSYADPETYVGPDPVASFDADDELVFMAASAGVRAPITAGTPVGALAGTGVELLISDPLDASVGYVYVFRSNGSLPPSAGQDAVSYQFQLLSGPYIPTYQIPGGGNPEDSVVATPFYRTHFSERWVRDELAVFAGGATGVDLLDRQRYLQAPGVCNRTEDTFSQGVGAFLANIDGPVRAIRSYMGANSGPLTQRVHTFYAQREDVSFVYRVHAIGRAGLDLFDYKSGVAGMTYANSLNPLGVPIDGIPETEAIGDLEWELVNGPHGSLIHAHKTTADFPITVQSYWSDYVNPPLSPCTGDASEQGASGSYGVSPMLNTDPRNLPVNYYEKDRTVYYGAPGANTATAALRASQALTPLLVGVRDAVVAGAVAKYCTSSQTACGSPSIDATGVPLASATSGFVVTATNLRGGKPGVLLYTDKGPANIPWTYGTMCLTAPRRAPTVVSTGTNNQCDGLFSIDMNAFAAGVLGGDPKAFLSVPGTQVNCQWWGRNSFQEGPFLSDALSYVVTAAPATVDPALSTVLVLPAVKVKANGADSATVKVTLRDTFGNPVAGKTVQIGATGSNNVVQQPLGPTDANGVATGTIASSTAEAKTITVTTAAVVLDTHPEVRFVGDPATVSLLLSSASASPTSVLANGVATATVTVTVRDAFGNVVPGQNVAISSSGGANTLTQPLGPTDAFGVATAQLASTLAQMKTITAVVNPQGNPVILAQQPTVLFTRDPSTIHPTLSSAVASPTAGVIANAVATATVTVTVRDAFGNAVPGQIVQLAATGSGNTLLQPAQPTNANGQATGTLASYVAESKTITVTVNPQGAPVVLDDQPVVQFVGDPATIQPGLSSAVAVPSTGVIANGTAKSTITVTVRDANGNLVPGQTVQLAATGSGNTLVQPAGPTNANGVATGTLASTNAGTKTVTVTINPQVAAIVLADHPTVAFVPDPGTIHPGLSSVVPVPSSGVLANGTAISTITVTVRDSNGNPVAGQIVQLAATGTANTLMQPLAPTNANGIATGTLATTKAEAKTLTVTVNPQGTPVVLTSQPTVTYVADPSTINPGLSSAVANPSSGLLANGSATATITVTVRDAFGNAVSGQTVQLAATGTGNTLVQPAGPTNASGIATGTLRSTVSGTKTVTVTVNPGAGQVVLSNQPTITFVADPSTISASLSSAVAVPSTGVVANGVATSTITVTVRDAFGNGVPGQAVQLASTGNGKTLVQPGPTNANGVTTGTLASTVAELKTLTVTVNPAGSAVVLNNHPTVSFVGDPSTISPSLSSAVAVPSSGVLPNGTATSTITVTVRDAFGNAVPSQTVQLAATGSGNILVQPSGPTNTSGVASGTLASTVGGTKTVTVTVNPQGSGVVLNNHPTVAFTTQGPVVTSAVPAFGTYAGGTLVTVNGSGFLNNNPGTNTVTFGGVAATNVSVIDDLKLTCRTPAGAHGALVNVAVSNNNGTGTLVNGFRFNDPPVVAQINEQFGDIGALYGFQVPASDPDPGETLTFTSVGTPLPTWAVLSPTTGVISGTPGTGKQGTTSGHVIAVSDGYNPPVNSNAFALTVAATPAVLAFGTPPSGSAVCGTPWSTFTVRIEDAFGNRVGTASNAITVARGTGTGSLSGQLLKNAVQGIATFSGLSYDKVEAMTINTTASGLAGLPNTAINVASGPAVQLAWVFAPTAMEQQGTVFTYVAAEVRDACGNRVTSDNTTQIELTVQSGMGVLGGTVLKTVQAGLATFEDVTYDRAETAVFQATSYPATTVLPSPVVDVRAKPVLKPVGRLSISSASAQSNDASTEPSLSADGRFVAFESVANNLVTGDTNNKRDVFVRDQISGTTERVSVHSAGTQATGDSFSPSISADGRYVAFHSVATNLVTGDANGAADVFVHDRLTKVTKRISVSSAGVEGNGASTKPSISAAGRFVAFESLATNLVASDTNVKSDVFVHDLLFAATIRVSVDSAGVQGNGDSRTAGISGNGACVAFESLATNLVAGDTNAKIDAFVRDRVASQTTRLSVSTAGAQADGDSLAPTLSFDGSSAAFESLATNLVTGDTNSKSDVFVRERSTNQTSRVSVSTAGVQGNNVSSEAQISADGLSVVYKSTATNLVCNAMSSTGLYVHRRAAAMTALVMPGANNDSSVGAISADGRSIAFASLASNLIVGDNNNKQDVFLTSLITLDTRISTGNDDAEDQTSATLLNSTDLELGNGDTNDAEGLRFQGVYIPRGATIHKAWIEFTVDETSSASTLVLLEGHAIDNAPTFTTVNASVTGRARTSAKVVWNIPAWNTLGQIQVSPDVSSVVQEIVSRPGWTSCNSLVIIITGTGTRTAVAYDGTANGAPLLHVEYSP